MTNEFLKPGRNFSIDFQNGGKTQLADYLLQHIFLVDNPFHLGKQYGTLVFP